MRTVNEHNPSIKQLLDNGRITQAEYDFLCPPNSAARREKTALINTVESVLRQRVSDIERHSAVGGALYALEEQRISVGKAIECLKAYCLDGVVPEYEPARGASEVDEVLRDLLRAVELMGLSEKQQPDILRKAMEAARREVWIAFPS